MSIQEIDFDNIDFEDIVKFIDKCLNQRYGRKSYNLPWILCDYFKVIDNKDLTSISLSASSKLAARNEKHTKHVKDLHKLSEILIELGIKDINKNKHSYMLWV